MTPAALVLENIVAAALAATVMVVMVMVMVVISAAAGLVAIAVEHNRARDYLCVERWYSFLHSAFQKVFAASYYSYIHILNFTQGIASLAFACPLVHSSVTP
jgi:hypothetical protein